MSVSVQSSGSDGNVRCMGGVQHNMSGLWILVAILLGLAAFGLWRRGVDGRMRARDGRVRLSAAQVGSSLGDKATLVQFTSAFCAPCRATRRILNEVAGMVPGVKHVDLDVDEYLELARELDIARTPTVLVLDADGRVVTRASGQPRKADVIAALGQTI